MSIRHAVLGLLAQRPRHGYELRAVFEAIVGQENWDVKPAQIYSTLTRMEKGGLVTQQAVEQDTGPEKRIYALTPAGREALRDWFTEGVAPEHRRDEFFVKLMLGLVCRAADPHQLIQTQRAELYRQLHTLTAQRMHLQPDQDLGRILLLEKAAMHLEADLRWLDLAETRLDEVMRQPLPEPEARPRGRPKKNPD